MTQDNLRRILGARDGETVVEAAERVAAELEAWELLPITGAQAVLLHELRACENTRLFYGAAEAMSRED